MAEALGIDGQQAGSRPFVRAALLPARPSARALALLGMVALLTAGGSDTVKAAPADAKARICRSLLLVLNPLEARISIESSRSIGFEDGITLTYDAQLPGERRRFRRLTCAFAKSRSARPDLIAVSSDGRSLGPARLTFLKRFWLTSPDALKADSMLGERR